MAASRPYKITATENSSDLANQLNRELGRIGRAIDTLSGQVAKSTTATTDPTTSAALAGVQAEVAAIQDLLRPMTVQGGSLVGGSVLTGQLGIPATTGAPVWAASTPISAGQQIRPTGAAADGSYYFEALGNGTTGPTEPLWNPEDGAVTPDGTVSGGWVQSGLAANTPIGTSSFANTIITGLSLPNNTWEQMTTATAYMGDINGPLLVGVNIITSSFTAGQAIDIDVEIQIPTTSGLTTYEVASRVTFAVTNVTSPAVSAVFSLAGTPAMYSLLLTPIPGKVVVTVYGKQATGAGQSITLGTCYVALTHS